MQGRYNENIVVRSGRVGCSRVVLVFDHIHKCNAAEAHAAVTIIYIYSHSIYIKYIVYYNKS